MPRRAVGGGRGEGTEQEGRAGEEYRPRRVLEARLVRLGVRVTVRGRVRARARVRVGARVRVRLGLGLVC